MVKKFRTCLELVRALEDAVVHMCVCVCVCVCVCARVASIIKLGGLFIQYLQ